MTLLHAGIAVVALRAQRAQQNGVAPRVVMEQMGHSTIAMSMNTYSHVIPALQREAAERLDTLLTGS
ncbi:MAG: hypothetical protein H0X16_05840 [Chloroflexi bacterium]|nr:hypothetical protein [Chloroflexota bacterium]